MKKEITYKDFFSLREAFVDDKKALSIINIFEKCFDVQMQEIEYTVSTISSDIIEKFTNKQVEHEAKISEMKRQLESLNSEKEISDLKLIEIKKEIESLKSEITGVA